MTQKPRKGDLSELKSTTFPLRSMPRIPIEACALGTRLGNRSVFILDPRPELPPMKIPRFGGSQRGDVAYRMFQLYRFDRGNKFSHVEGWSLLKDVRIKTLFSVAVTEVMSIWFRCKRTGLTV